MKQAASPSQLGSGERAIGTRNVCRKPVPSALLVSFPAREKKLAPQGETLRKKEMKYIITYLPVIVSEYPFQLYQPCTQGAFRGLIRQKQPLKNLFSLDTIPILY